MTTTVREAEDIIGMVPHTLGYTPSRSLVTMIIVTEADGTRSVRTTMRMDFDIDTAAHILQESAGFYRDMILGACQPTGVFLILYDEDCFGEPDSVDHVLGPESFDDNLQWQRSMVRGAIDEIAITLDAIGIDTLGAWWVTDKHFGRIDEPNDPGTPLSAATSSVCATECVAAGSSPVASPGELVARPDEPAREDLAGQTDPHSHTDPHSGKTLAKGARRLPLGDAFERVSRIYPALLKCRGPHGERPDHEAVSAVMTPELVHALDSILSRKWSRDALEMILSFDHPNFLPAEIVQTSPAELYQRAVKFGPSREAALEIVGLSNRTPNPQDILLGIEFLEIYVRRAHPSVRPTTYAVIAWFEWALGGSTMAEQYALAALAEDPEQSMAGLILTAVEAGMLPRWLSGQRGQPSTENSPRRE